MHTVPSLTNGTRYYFQVRATNANGNSPSSWITSTQLAASPSVAVTIPDANLRTALEQQMGKSAGATITQLDMAKLPELLRLQRQRPPISLVTGLEHAVNVAFLSLDYNSISDLSPLASLNSLTSLSLRGNSISDLSPLASSTSLRWLTLNNNSISDLSPLASLTSPRGLYLSDNSISDLSPLASSTSLTHLSLSNNPISDLSPLASLNSLTFLSLRGNSISDLSPLASLTSLQSLYLHGNSISDLSPLASLTSLQFLYLDNNSISDLSPLASLNSLTQLLLHGNSISDLSPLASLTDVDYLGLDGNSISDLSPLASLTSLRALHLDDNSISDATPLASLAGLLSLSLRGNPIDSLADIPVASLGSLVRLYLSGSWISNSVLASLVADIPSVFNGLTLEGGSISDLTPLASLTNVDHLDLSDNAISDISPLLTIFAPAPFTIDLRGNPLSAESVNTHIPTLQRLYSPETLLFDALTLPLPTPNRSPQAVSSISDVTLAPRASFALDAASHFSDPDLDALTYSVMSGTPAVATAALSPQGRVSLRAIAEGSTRVIVTATDPGGLTASIGFTVVVGNPASFDGATGNLAASAFAPEGGVASLTVLFAEAREADVSFRYTLGVDADPATADADAEDYDDAGGTVTIPAGETSAAISIRIRDDADVEPPREVFTVTLEPPDGVRVGGSAVAVVHIKEGVCDRSEAVRVALSSDDCSAPDAAALAAVRALGMERRGIGSLRADDFAGLSALRSLNLRGNALATLPADLLSAVPGLRHLDLSDNALETLAPGILSAAPALRWVMLGGNRLAQLDEDALAGLTDLGYLDLSDNALEELPNGLFADIGDLRSAHLQGNPGAPFALRLALARTDAAPWSPGPATVELTLPTGAPFDIEPELTVVGGTLRDAAGTPAASAPVPAGATTSGALTAQASAGADVVRIAAAVPLLPTTICDGAPCWRGLQLAAAKPLVLFARPPTAGPVPAPAPLFGDTLRLPLDSLATAGDAGDLRWTVSSSDEAVVTARLATNELVVEPVEFAEGVARIEVAATDAAGQSVTMAFDVHVEFHWPVRATVGWRSVLGHADALATAGEKRR